VLRAVSVSALVAGTVLVSLAMSSGVAAAQGLVWVQAPTPNPGPANAADFLTRVSCVSTSDCWTVGYSEPGSPDAQSVTMHWDGSGWSTVPSSDPGGSGEMNALRAVACASTWECWAVGSVGGMTLAVNASVPTAGYWEVASDGGLFTFGNAQFCGSMGGKPLNAPVVDLATVGAM